MTVILLCFNGLGDRTALMCRLGFIAMVPVLLSNSGLVPPATLGKIYFEELAHAGQLLQRVLNQK